MSESCQSVDIIVFSDQALFIQSVAKQFLTSNLVSYSEYAFGQIIGLVSLMWANDTSNLGFQIRSQADNQIIALYQKKYIAFPSLLQL